MLLLSERCRGSGVNHVDQIEKLGNAIENGRYFILVHEGLKTKALKLGLNGSLASWSVKVFLHEGNHIR